jgi:hypothetical protein
MPRVMLTTLCYRYSASNKRRASDKHDNAHVTPKRQRRVSEGTTTLTTKKNFASEQSREPKRAFSGPQKSPPDPPGPGWQFIHAKETNIFARYWISPVRCIVFKRHKQACEFEKLRSKYGSDEVLAWKEYRKMKFGLDVCVVAPYRYDENSK